MKGKRVLSLALAALIPRSNKKICRMLRRSAALFLTASAA